MNFLQTGLPDQPLFRGAFKAGLEKYIARFYGDEMTATAQYASGPVAMARLIFGHAGKSAQAVAAACLAGPAVFSAKPDSGLHDRLLEFSQNIQRLGDLGAVDVCRKLPEMPADTRLFFQASAILLLEQIVDPVSSWHYTREEKAQTYMEALDIYSAARGSVDAYSLDTRFEIAAMKVMSVLENAGNSAARQRPAASSVNI